MTAAAAMIGGRRKRSASQPMGRAPSTMNALDAALTKTITPSLTPKLSRMSGASTPSEAPSRFSTDVEQQQHDEGVGPADGEALLEGQRLVADPGQEVVGEEDLLLLLGGLALGLGFQHRVGQRRGLGDLVGRAHTVPPILPFSVTRT